MQIKGKRYNSRKPRMSGWESRMIHRRETMTLSMALVIASCGMLAAEDAEPGAKSIPLRQRSPGYQELLSGPPASVHMKSGLVLLEPGKSSGKHSTEDHEEMVIVLSGHGQVALANG